MQGTSEQQKGLTILMLAYNEKEWACPAIYYEQQAILDVMPGSVIYGPGFIYNTNKVPEIVKETFGNSRPDAIMCYINERPLLGEPLDKATIEKYGLSGDMRVFPRDLRKVDIPKIAWINDFWHCNRDEWEQILLGNGFQFAFSTYCPPFGRTDVFAHFFSRRVRESVRFIPWPRAMSPEIYRDYGLEKIYDVTLLGALEPSLCYPLRNLMHKKFSSISNIVYFNNPHPGYRYVDPSKALVGENYARAINQSKIFATCTSIYHIPLMKLFEAIACKSALMCDPPCGAEYLGFVDGETYAAVNKSNFLDRTKWLLAHPEEIERISLNGLKLFTSRHTVDIRAREFRQIISSILTGKEPESYAALWSHQDALNIDRSLHFISFRRIPIPSKMSRRWIGVRLALGILRRVKRIFRLVIPTTS
ncbi:MAG: glycosyltransferase family protein [Armatimonadota bacterium]